MTEKMMAEWFWVDRWELSRAAVLPMEARGLYREMLSQAWRLDNKLPMSHSEIQIMVRCRPDEWDRSWPLVAQFWTERDGSLVPLEDLGGCKPRPGQTGHRPHIPLAIRRAVYERDGYKCLWCGAEAVLSLDHIIPYSQGGPDTIDNLRVLCLQCNRIRGARD